MILRAFDGRKNISGYRGKKSAHQKRPRNAKEPGRNSTFVGAFGKWALKIPAIVRSNIDVGFIHEMGAFQSRFENQKKKNVYRKSNARLARLQPQWNPPKNYYLGLSRDNILARNTKYLRGCGNSACR